jgi:hypothetical protein
MSAVREMTIKHTIPMEGWTATFDLPRRPLTREEYERLTAILETLVARPAHGAEESESGEGRS